MRTVLLVSACTLLGGCASSMIRSYPASSAPTDKHLELVGEYGLVTSKIQVTVSAPAQGGGDKADEPAGVNFNSSITVNTVETEAAEPVKEPAPVKPQTQASVCADIRKAYNEDRVAQFAAYKRLTDFQITVATWRQGLPTADTEKAAALKQLDGFLVRRAQDAAAADQAASLHSLIPKCPQPITVALKEVLEIDRETYRLYSTPGWMADNNLTVELAGGYIKTINATAEDRTADVVVETAKSLGQITTLGEPLAMSVVRAQSSALVSASNVRINADEELADAAALIRTKGFTVATVNGLQQALSLALGQADPTLLPPIDADLPLVQTFSLANLEVGKSLAPLLGVTLTVECSNSADTSGKTTSPQGGPQYYEGILISAERSCTAIAKRTVLVNGGTVAQPTETPEQREVGRIHFSAADASMKSQLSTPRQAFVKSTSIYTFDGGRLAKSETIRPSPVVSFASVPGKAIGGFVGGVTSGLKGKSDTAEAETARVDSEIKRVTKARELKALYNKKDDADAPAASADTAASPDS